MDSADDEDDFSYIQYLASLSNSKEAVWDIYDDDISEDWGNSESSKIRINFLNKNKQSSKSDGGQKTTEQLTTTAPMFEDQIREYRQNQRRLHNARRTTQRIGRRLAGRTAPVHTIEQQLDPQVELQASMTERASIVPAEILYHSRRDDEHYRVYIHRSEKPLLVINSSQVDKNFIQEESFHQLQRSRMQYIHIGILQRWIKDYLYGKKLHLPLAGKKPESMSDGDWNLLDRQVLGVIRLTLSKNMAHNVAKETSTEGLMKVLSDMYEKPSANNWVFLMKKLFHLKMAEGAFVATHLNEFNTIVNQLSSIEINFDDEVRALILLASLPNSWEPMQAAVSNFVGSAKLNFNDVRDRILAEEVRRIDSREMSASNSALNIEGRGRGSNRNFNTNKGRSKTRNGRNNS
ncbi:hypothetical protein ZIOFF_015849 [Zingiber officinale]|uniref:Retrovirus-related Pol polyprotein from transposon TNT 1-94 n=1 Tax=Zingiber officinale TaxID=94328 RepID=A0A8J5HES9_ZINOF|nr:hypothetical protein ZIOFF_015849 [Zingiber officinale]